MVLGRSCGASRPSAYETGWEGGTACCPLSGQRVPAVRGPDSIFDRRSTS
jgi:hypothetical protein